MKKFTILLLVFLLFLNACTRNNADARSYRTKKSSRSLTKTTMATQRVTFQTTDGVTIVGDWSLPSGAKNIVLLLHMMPATRTSYGWLAEALNKGNFATLAIDLRGHGESTAQGGKNLNYQNFSDSEHQASRLDVDAAMNFLKGKGFNEGKISFVGASIGANLSLDAMYRYNGTRRAVLLSPGLDYRGVKTEQAMKGLLAQQKAWIVVARGDSYSAQSSLTLQKLRPENSTVTMFQGSDHGTNLFVSQPNLIPDIVKFLST